MAGYDIHQRIADLRDLAEKFEAGEAPLINLPLPHTIKRLDRMKIAANKARLLRRMADYLEVNNG